MKPISLPKFKHHHQVEDQKFYLRWDRFARYFQFLRAYTPSCSLYNFVPISTQITREPTSINIPITNTYLVLVVDLLSNGLSNFPPHYFVADISPIVYTNSTGLNVKWCENILVFYSLLNKWLNFEIRDILLSFNQRFCRNLELGLACNQAVSSSVRFCFFRGFVQIDL